jgi:RNA polymerase sigma factor (sigma-70 family)
MATANRDDDPVSLAVALAGVAEHNQAAFKEIYHRTSVKLFGVCLRILPVRHEAEEALQEVYLSVWRRAGMFDPARGSAMTWLITLARNCAIDRLRSGARFRAAPIELADEVPDPSPSASATAENNEEERRLAECLEILGTRDSRLLGAAFFEGSTYAELAERASMPLGSIKSRIRRALIRLRECLA